MEKEHILKTKKATTLFALAALVGGFLFLSPSITGGAILESASGFRPLSLIGLGLIACAIILAGYALKKNKTI
ncbi:MAG: hypothetical protein ACW98D_20295 [Promethearchaeota archaeon]